ncbi:MAG: hypothetical protein ACRCTJ_00495 [Brevinema sp.]
MKTVEYIGKLALFLHENQTQMSLQELAVHLNRNQLFSNTGQPFSNENQLGIGKYISTCYYLFKDKNDQVIADAIALSFVRKDGTPAWDK